MHAFSSTTGALLRDERAALSFLPKSARTIVVWSKRSWARAPGTTERPFLDHRHNRLNAIDCPWPPTTTISALALPTRHGVQRLRR